MGGDAWQRRHRGRGSAGHLRQVWGRPPPKRSPEPPPCPPGSQHPSSAPPDGPRLRPGWAVGAGGRVHTPGCRPLPVCPWASEGASGLLPGWLSGGRRVHPAGPSSPVQKAGCPRRSGQRAPSQPPHASTRWGRGPASSLGRELTLARSHGGFAVPVPRVCRSLRKVFKYFSFSEAWFSPLPSPPSCGRRYFCKRRRGGGGVSGCRASLSTLPLSRGRTGVSFVPRGPVNCQGAGRGFQGPQRPWSPRATGTFLAPGWVWAGPCPWQTAAPVTVGPAPQDRLPCPSASPAQSRLGRHSRGCQGPEASGRA